MRRVPLRHLLLALVLAIPAGVRAQAAPRDSASAIVARFLTLRRAAWQASEVKRHRMPAGSAVPGFGGDPRLQRMHCHGDHAVQGVEIASASRLRACPGWVPRGDTIPGDERVDADAALVPAQRDTVREARARVLAALARLALLAPDDPFILGQRVRLGVDQGDTSGVRALVRQCGAADWWCALLRAWAAHELGGRTGSGAAFAAALAIMPAEERCRWTDIEPLLDGNKVRARYHALPCAGRAREERRFWWLADPLWSEAGNDRWTEHLARRVTVALRAAVPADDRMHWAPRYGGDAMVALVIRYGWPAYFWWAGEEEDASHREWTQQAEHRWTVAPRVTFWSAEYPTDRVAVTPDAAQWADPFDAAAWAPAKLVAPVGKETRWKPREHWAPAPPFAPLADLQVTLLRRHDGTLVVAATDPALVVGRRLLAPGGDSLLAALVLATGPDAVTTLDERRVAAGGPVVLSGVVRDTGAALLAVELRPSRAVAAPRAPRRRARAGIALPPSLATMGRDARAVSAPVLVEATDDAPPDDVRALQRLMLDGASTGDRARVGLYWETYGWPASDTLQVTLRVVRLDRGVLSRLAGALRIPGFRADGRDAASVTWTEVPRGAPPLPDERVPVRAWMRTLDLRALPSGRYEVEVAVGRAGEAPVAERRRFGVRR